MQCDEDLQRLLDYLCPRDRFDCAQVLVLLGSALPCAAQWAAELCKKKHFWHVVVSGGEGHSTKLLRQAVKNDKAYAAIAVEHRSEAEIFADIMHQHRGVPNLILDTASTNCGDNAAQTKRILDNKGIKPATIAIIQDPTMQRRSAAAFAKTFPGARIFSAPPFHITAQSAPLYGGMERMMQLALGEIPRLVDDENGYGPRGKGFIAHVDVPPDVLAAHARLCEKYPQFAGR